jgi:hypothetical protein
MGKVRENPTDEQMGKVRENPTDPTKEMKNRTLVGSLQQLKHINQDLKV